MDRRISSADHWKASEFFDLRIHDEAVGRSDNGPSPSESQWVVQNDLRRTNWVDAAWATDDLVIGDNRFSRPNLRGVETG